jgi:methionyl-tRNA formyltransferase
MKFDFFNKRIAIIGGHLTTDIMLKEIKKKIIKKIDVYYYVPHKIKNLILYVNLKNKNNFLNDNFIKFTSLKKIEDKIITKKYDYIFAIGLSQILSSKLIKSVKENIIGFHPTYLPYGKGRSSVAWNIKLRKNGGASFFLIKDGEVDTGEIIYRRRIKILKKDTSNSYTKKYLKHFKSMAKEILEKPYFYLNQQKSNKNFKGSNYSLLKPSDSFIDWNESTDTILSLIKSAGAPHPGAFSFIGNKIYKIQIGKPAKFAKKKYHAIVGTILERNKNSYLVKTKDSQISVSINENINVGSRFTQFNPYIFFQILKKLKMIKF